MKRKVFCLAGLLALSGCTKNMVENKEFEEEFNQNIEEAIALETETYKVIHEPYVEFKPAKIPQKKRTQFDEVMIDMSIIAQAPSLGQLVEMFNKRQVPVVVQPDVDASKLYTGYVIKAVPARRALDLITMEMGLHYEIMDEDSEYPYAVITGLPTMHYVLTVPNQTTTIRQVINNIAQQSQPGITQSTLAGSSTGGGAGNSSAGVGGSSADRNSIINETEIVSRFWDELEKYLRGMLVERLPNPAVMQTAQMQQGSQFNNQQGFVPPNIATGQERMISIANGEVVTNRVTGDIQIIAPRHRLKAIEKVLRRIDIMMNTSIVIKGKLIAIDTTDRQSAGIDIAGLASQCASNSDFRCIVTNDALGNVSIIEPGVSSFFDATVDSVVPGPLLGLQAIDQTWQVFNAYTEGEESIKTIREFGGETTHGASLSNKFTQQRVNQLLSVLPTVTTDGVATSGGTENELITYELGYNVTVTPFLDTQTAKVDSIVDIKLKLPGEITQIRQVTSAGESTSDYQNVNELEFQVRPSLKNGQLIIAGTLEQQTETKRSSGLKGTSDTQVAGLFGSANSVLEKVKYYVVMQVKVVPPRVI